MKTFLQRWWIINRLSAFCKIKGGIVWADEKEFIKYIEKIIINKNKQSPDNIYLVSFPYSWLGEVRDDILAYSKIQNIIDECADPKDGVGYIVKRDVNSDSLSNNLPDFYLRLSSIGRERHGWDYIIFNKFFGNVWVKTIGIGIIMIFVAYYINTHIFIVK